MDSMNISLPEDMKEFVQEQVAERSFGSASEYFRQLLRVEREREWLRDHLLSAMAEPPSRTSAEDFMSQMRTKIQEQRAAS